MPGPSIHHLPSAWALLARYQAIVLASPAFKLVGGTQPSSAGLHPADVEDFHHRPVGFVGVPGDLAREASDCVDCLDQLANRCADAGADVQGKSHIIVFLGGEYDRIGAVFDVNKLANWLAGAPYLDRGALAISASTHLRTSAATTCDRSVLYESPGP